MAEDVAVLQRRILNSENLYDILGVSRAAPQADIAKRYKRLCLLFHPDKNSAEHAEEAFKKIGKAYETLRDPSSRSLYDATHAYSNGLVAHGYRQTSHTTSTYHQSWTNQYNPYKPAPQPAAWQKARGPTGPQPTTQRQAPRQPASSSKPSQPQPQPQRSYSSAPPPVPPPPTAPRSEFTANYTLPPAVRCPVQDCAIEFPPQDYYTNCPMCRIYVFAGVWKHPYSASSSSASAGSSGPSSNPSSRTNANSSSSASSAGQRPDSASASSSSHPKHGSSSSQPPPQSAAHKKAAPDGASASSSAEDFPRTADGAPDFEAMKASQLKAWLVGRGVGIADCIERSDFVTKATRVWHTLNSAGKPEPSPSSSPAPAPAAPKQEPNGDAHPTTAPPGEPPAAGPSSSAAAGAPPPAAGPSPKQAPRENGGPPPADGETSPTSKKRGRREPEEGGGGGEAAGLAPEDLDGLDSANIIEPRLRSHRDKSRPTGASGPAGAPRKRQSRFVEVTSLEDDAEDEVIEEKPRTKRPRQPSGAYSSDRTRRGAGAQKRRKREPEDAEVVISEEEVEEADDDADDQSYNVDAIMGWKKAGPQLLVRWEGPEWRERDKWTWENREAFYRSAGGEVRRLVKSFEAKHVTPGLAYIEFDQAGNIIRQEATTGGARPRATAQTTRSSTRGSSAAPASSAAAAAASARWEKATAAAKLNADEGAAVGRGSAGSSSSSASSRRGGSRAEALGDPIVVIDVDDE